MKSAEALLLIFLVAFSVNAAFSQSSNLDQLKSEYQDKKFLLRAFYTSNKLEFDSTGRLVSKSETGSWTVATVLIKEIVPEGNGYRITGQRMGTWYEGWQTHELNLAKMQIKVTTAGPADLRVALRQIFVQPDEQLSKLIPRCWWNYLNYEKEDDARAEAGIAPANSGPPDPTAPKVAVSAPRAIKTPDPKYSKEAESQKIQGTVVLWLIVDKDGAPNAIRIMRPLGMGLDERAVEAVSAWRFKPAMKDGQPVPVQINVEVNFRL